MTTLNIERQPAEVKHFFETLTLTPGRSVFELNGKHVTIRVLSDEESKWTPAKNDRRCELIERDIDGTITPDESLELELLQEAMREHVENVAPIPLRLRSPTP